MGRADFVGRRRRGPYERRQLRTLAALAARFHTSIDSLEDRPMWQILDMIDLADRQD